MRGGTRYESELDVDLEKFLKVFDEEDRYHPIVENFPIEGHHQQRLS